MNMAMLMRELAAAVDAPVLDGDAVAPYLRDATEARGLRGQADAVVLARTADDVVRVLSWCYEHDCVRAPAQAPRLGRVQEVRPDRVAVEHRRVDGRRELSHQHRHIHATFSR